MRAALGYAVPRNHNNLIRVFYGGKSVRDNKGGSAFGKFCKRALYKHLRRVIQRRSRFIQNEYGRIFQKGAGYGNALFLSARKFYATLARGRIIAFGQALNIVVYVRLFSRFRNLRVRRPEISERDIFAYGAVEKKNVLLHNAYIFAQRLPVQRAYVVAVNAYYAFVYFVKAGDKVAYSGLAAARRSYQRNGFAGGDFH